MRFKNLTALFLALVFVLSICSMKSTVKAEEIVFENAKVTVADSVADFELNSDLSWSCTLSSEENNQMVYAYASFTIKEDSYVIASVNKTEPISAYTSPDFSIFSNKGLTNEKISMINIRKSDKAASFLPAGTYYMKVQASKLYGQSLEFTLDVSIGAIPVHKLLSVDTKIDNTKNTATIMVNEGLGERLKNIQYIEGKLSNTYINDEKYWMRRISSVYESFGYTTGYKATVLKNNKFTVKKNGTYTLRIADKDGNAYSINFTVKGLDNTVPAVTGVKNGATYKKPVTIKFSDSGTGIKKATLNNKTISTNKQVSAKGKYTLKVTDKAGNTRTVNFTIK